MVYQAGLIGTGGIAGMGILGMHDKAEIGKKKFKASHAGGYHAVEEIELTAIADVNDEKLHRFGDAWDIPLDRRYSGHEQMLQAEDLDAVSVCSPTFLHKRHVLDAAQSTADPALIWCEKPIASSVSDAEEMIDVCKDTDTELVVNHSFRFTSKLQQLRSLVRDGLIGDIKSVHGGFRREFLRNSTHLLDSLFFVLDDDVATVSGYVNGENDAVDSLDGNQGVDDAGGGGFAVLEDGTFITIDCTVARDISSMTLQFIGTDGKLYLNNDDGEWRYWTLNDGQHIEHSIPDIDGSWSWETDYRNAFPNAANHIVDVLDDKAENISSGHEAKKSIEVIVGFYISHFTSGQVSLPLDRPLRDVTITSW